MKQTYFNYIKNQFPALAESSIELLSDNLISPYQLKLTKKIMNQAEDVVKALFALRENSHYQSNVYQRIPSVAQRDPGNKSICMSYDFHLDQNGNLKLIEVNTNAAFLLMGYFLYGYRNLPRPVMDFSLDEIKQNILEEFQLSEISRNPLSSIAIVDDAPSSQKLYFEFLLFEQLFNQFGLKAFIADPSELKWKEGQLNVIDQRLDFIYNRTTDFYFEQNTHEMMREAYSQKAVTLSPNPHEYALLADKQRLIDWSLWCRDLNSPFHHSLTKIAPQLLEATILKEQNSAEIWAQKKKYFFKPMVSFGSKGTYRGEGISRVHFDHLKNTPTLVQEFCPASEQIFEANGFPSTKLKYDLRFYAYKDRIQMAVARLYQGQVTNLKTPLGGFAPIEFI